MKAIAMYLPQFHRTKENDAWWGEGFTDWTAVREALPLFAGHEQPRVPMNENYYNLLDKETMLLQAQLMKRYQVDGLCLYHYYFENGRKILERPLENLLMWKDVEIPFCLCWANESWIRSWSHIPAANSWADKYEIGIEQTGEGYLLKQGYGQEKDWIEHFNYLLPFFKDERYIKVEGKPLFWIYSAFMMPCIYEMVQCWKKQARINGLEGLYIIGSFCNNGEQRFLDGSIVHEPLQTIINIKSEMVKEKDMPYCLDYDEVWQKMLDSMPGSNKTYFEGFTGFDDTPRRGKNGTSVLGGNPEKFARYLTELFAKSEASGSEIVFINAWNEWAEGMYLEPDIKYGHGYLEAVASAKKIYTKNVKTYKTVLQLKMDVDKLNQYLDLTETWFHCRQQGKSVADYLLDEGIHTVGVYGYSRFGKMLLDELEGSKVKAAFLIDKKTDLKEVPLPLYRPEDSLPFCEAIIVSAPYYFEEIKRTIVNNDNFKIISIKEIIETLNGGL